MRSPPRAPVGSAAAAGSDRPEATAESDCTGEEEATAAVAGALRAAEPLALELSPSPSSSELEKEPVPVALLSESLNECDCERKRSRAALPPRVGART